MLVCHGPRSKPHNAAWMFEAKLPCDSFTPLGIPVVPEV
jgi:hypothetical protein